MTGSCEGTFRSSSRSATYERSNRAVQMQFINYEVAVKWATRSANKTREDHRSEHAGQSRSTIDENILNKTFVR